MSMYKLNSRDMGYFQDIVDRHLVRILRLDGVFRFGVGYKMKNGSVTDEINLIALVNKKQTTLPASQRVPSQIDGVQTDVIGIQSLANQSIANSVSTTANTAVAVAGLIADRNKKFDPLTGGVPIRNTNVGVNNVGVMGAVVFDRAGNAFGLSAQHAIGDQTPGHRAKRGDPINQPLSFDKSDEIGVLSRFDLDYDAALFQLEANRRYEPKMLASETDPETTFELSEASQARIGQLVECPARRTHTRGKVHYYFSHIRWVRRSGVLQPKKIRTVVIEFQKGFTQTMAGDSGAVWVDIKSKSPVALHSGIKHVWLPNNRVTTVAVGTCMQQLVEWGNFRFSVPNADNLRSLLSEYETAFVTRNSDLLAFCHAPGRAQKLVVKKFDTRLKQIGQKQNSIYPKSGLAVSKFKNNIYAAWRSASDKIQIARLKPSSLEFYAPATSGLLTRRKPAMVQFNNRLVIAYMDATTQRLKVAHCDRNWNWKQFEVTNIQSTQAPAMAVFKNKIYICWSDVNNRMKIAEMNLSSYSRSISYYDSLGTKKSNEDPSLAVFDGKLCLAYTTLRNELRIVQSSDVWEWTVRRKDTELKSAPPNLIEYDGQLIYVR